MTSSSERAIGTTHLQFVSLSSTNRRALDLIAKTRPQHGTVISAAYQYNGLGQFGRTWHSAPGKNLLFSIIMYPRIAAQQQFLLTAMCALALQKMLSSLIQAPIQVKWPNDIYVQNLKLAGTLIQCTISGARIQHAVAGIGLNVNQRSFPEDIPNPTSIALLTGRAHHICPLLRDFLVILNALMADLADQAPQDIIAMYNTHMYGMNKTMRFRDAATEREFEGIIRGVADTGQLLVELSGRLCKFSTHEIVYLLDSQ